jgi:hypothetical protein
MGKIKCLFDIVFIHVFECVLKIYLFLKNIKLIFFKNIFDNFNILILKIKIKTKIIIFK